MIVKVWGEINGTMFVPTITSGDMFYFTPPPTPNGRYICQFWAEDDYGNVTNETAILTIFDGMVKCIEVVTREWAVTMLNDPWTMEAEYDPWEVKMDPITCSNDMMEVFI